MEKLFGFIGIGNMGGTLARCACRALGGKNVLVADIAAEKVNAISQEYGCTAADAAGIAERADYIFLGAKPQGMAALLSGIAPTLAARKTRSILVSMAAGMKIEAIKALAGGEYPVIRLMPNLAAEVGEGMLLYTPSEEVSREEIGGFCAAMAQAGQLDCITEAQMNAGSAIAGCVPAFAYMFINSLADGGVMSGLSYDKAVMYAAQAVAGAARMVLSGKGHPEALKTAVCSPAGSTIEGVKALEDAAFRAAVMDAIMAAYEKTAELGR